MKIKTEFIYDDETEQIEVTSQKVVDEDENWNFARNKEMIGTVVNGKVCTVTPDEDVKKCRDLSMQDLSIKENWTFKEIVEILNNRFGDL